MYTFTILGRGGLGGLVASESLLGFAPGQLWSAPWVPGAPGLVATEWLFHLVFGVCV